MSHAIVGSFQINTTGNRTTEEVVAAGKYEEVVRCINLNYPLRPMPEGGREIVLMQFKHDPKFPVVLTSELAIEVAKRHGLERPRYEDVLFFGEQYPKKGQNQESVVFLHDPRFGLGNEVILAA